MRARAADRHTRHTDDEDNSPKGSGREAVLAGTQSETKGLRSPSARTGMCEVNESKRRGLVLIQTGRLRKDARKGGGFLTQVDRITCGRMIPNQNLILH